MASFRGLSYSTAAVHPAAAGAPALQSLRTVLRGFVPSFLATLAAPTHVAQAYRSALGPTNVTPASLVGSAARPARREWVGAAVARLNPLRNNLDAIFSMLMSDKAKLVSKEDALPGRGTPMQLRNQHFVLKTPIQPPFPAGLQTVVLGTGCFWGSEKMFWKLPGVYSTAVGYAAGHTPNPTYEEVCTGKTAHNEVVLVVYDPAKVSFVDLLRNFWESHDPTQGMGQGNDRGTQYRSGIYPTTAEQQQLAEASLGAYQTALAAQGYPKITTEIVPNVVFYYAEDYHQQYLAKPGSRPYCSAQPTGVALPAFAQWAPPGLEGHAPHLPDPYWAANGPKPGCTIKGSNAQNQWP
eukprot:EG_transcript_10588